MMKSIQKSLKMYEMGSEMLKYWMQCLEKSEILKSDEIGRKMKVGQMGLPGVENVPTPRKSIFTLSRGSQLPYMKTSKNIYFVLVYSTHAEINWGFGLHLTEVQNKTNMC